MSITESGLSVTGRQILIDNVPSGLEKVAVGLPNVSQGQQYIYKGFVTVEDTTYGVDLQIAGYPIYWEGVHIALPVPTSATARVVAYWRYSEIDWVAITSP